MEHAEVGTIVECEVARITAYGAFCRVTGLEYEGLVLLPDFRWGKISSPREVVSENDVLSAMVLKHDSARKLIRLSVKHLSPDPWDVHSELLQAGVVVAGKVVQIADYGVFVAVAEDVEGLLHIDAIRRGHPETSHPSAVLSVGDTVVVEVGGVDIEERRIQFARLCPA